MPNIIFIPKIWSSTSCTPQNCYQQRSKDYRNPKVCSKDYPLPQFFPLAFYIPLNFIKDLIMSCTCPLILSGILFMLLIYPGPFPNLSNFIPNFIHSQNFYLQVIHTQICYPNKIYYFYLTPQKKLSKPPLMLCLSI